MEQKLVAYIFFAELTGKCWGSSSRISSTRLRAVRHPEAQGFLQGVRWSLNPAVDELALS